MITISDIKAIQKEVATTFGDPMGVRDEDALLQALSRPFAVENGIPVYPTFFNRLSVLFQQLVEKRPFLGGNRRTALLTLVVLLDGKGYTFKAEQKDVDVLFLGVEAGYTTWHRVTAWIKKHTVKPVPKRTGKN